MFDDHSISQSAMDEVKKMLQEHLAKRLADLKPGDGVAVSVSKDEPKPDMPHEEPDGDEPEAPGEDEKDEPEAPAADDKYKMNPEHASVHEAAMKKLDQILRPKKG